MEYKTNESYTSNIQISGKCYKSKPSSYEISSMSWNPMEVSISTLSTLISNGYAFCPTDRTLSNVSNSNYICIDIDNSTIPMDEYVTNLLDKPTIYYTTPSNGNVDKSLKKYGDDKHIYRFRLLYALDKPTKDANEYMQAHSYIARTNNMQFVDKLQANQYYNGSYGCKPIITNYTYTLPEEFKNEPIKESKTKLKTGSLEKVKYYHRSFTISDEPVFKDYLSMKLTDFIDKYDAEFAISIKTKSDYLNDGLDDPVLWLPDDYIEVPRKYYWDKTNKGYIIKKWKDGENRHKKLFIAGIIMRKLNPDFDLEMMLYALNKEMMLAYENGDGRFYKKYMIQLAKNVMNADLAKELKGFKHPKFKVNELYCYENRISVKSVANSINAQLKGQATFEDIDYFYEPNETLNGKRISNSKWVEILNENGVKVSLSTFKRYLNDKGYSTSKTNKTGSLEIVKNNHRSFTISDELVFEDYYNSNKRFMEICNKIHFGDCDFSEELKYFNERA